LKSSKAKAALERKQAAEAAAAAAAAAAAEAERLRREEEAKQKEQEAEHQRRMKEAKQKQRVSREKRKEHESRSRQLSTVFSFPLCLSLFPSLFPRLALLLIMSASAIAAFPSSCALTAIVQDREAAIQADRASRHSRLKDALRALDKAVKKGGAVTEEDKAVKRAINECKAIGGLDDEVADASAALEAAQEIAASSGGGANQVEDPTQAIIDDLKANGEACYIDPGFPHTEASISPDPSRKCLVSSQTCSCLPSAEDQVLLYLVSQTIP
jgi:hypothetical protein